MSCVRKGSNELTTLKVDKITPTDDVDIAETMNSYFSSVFISEDYANFPEYDNTVDMKLSIIHCKTSEISHPLRNLNPNKSPWSDLLLPRVMKECAAEMADSLYLLVNRSFSSGQVPLAWRKADIVPIHKKGKKSSKENYLTSIACKVGEKIVKSSGQEIPSIWW